MFLWGEDNVWKKGDRKQVDGSNMRGMYDYGTHHLVIETINCGTFFVPMGNITLQYVGKSWRVLFRDDPEWRDIDEDEAKFITDEIASNI